MPLGIGLGEATWGKGGSCLHPPVKMGAFGNLQLRYLCDPPGAAGGGEMAPGGSLAPPGALPSMACRAPSHHSEVSPPASEPAGEKPQPGIICGRMNLSAQDGSILESCSVLLTHAAHLGEGGMCATPHLLLHSKYQH